MAGETPGRVPSTPLPKPMERSSAKKNTPTVRRVAGSIVRPSGARTAAAASGGVGAGARETVPSEEPTDGTQERARKGAAIAVRRPIGRVGAAS